MEGDDDRLSTRVLEAVADREGVDPVDLEPPLYEAVDPDALDALFRGGGGRGPSRHGAVEFRYCGYDVAVDWTGAVELNAVSASSPAGSSSAG